MKFLALSALAASAAAQYAAPAPAPAAYVAPAPAPAAYVAPAPAYAPAPAPAPAVPFALQAGQCQTAAMAGKAVFAKFCFAPKVGSPLDKVLGLVDRRLNTLEAAANLVTNNSAAVQTSAAALTASFATYTTQVQGCTAGVNADWAQYQDCMAANAGFCYTNSSTPSCPRGYNCAAFNAASATTPTSGFCAPMAAEEFCAAWGCPITAEPSAYVCYLQSLGPPKFHSCVQSCSPPGDNCSGFATLECVPAGLPGYQAYPVGVYACQNIPTTR